MHKELQQKLLKHLQFLEIEVGDYAKFESLTRDEYTADRDRRRNVERWAENIINSVIAIAKVILTIESIPLPDSNKEAVRLLSSIKLLGIVDASEFADWTRFRNILAHEYVDIRWRSLERFIRETGPLYKDFVLRTKSYLKKLIDPRSGSSLP
jgi:uncharacterized protein YutE (UPF0331/DUF86 family)